MTQRRILVVEDDAAIRAMLDRHGVAQAVVSSSRNARPVLAAAGLGDRFEHVVDGITLTEQHLAGKPAPDMFLHAAALLGVAPERCVVVEDASSGVAAGAAGGFGSGEGDGRDGRVFDDGGDLASRDPREAAAHGYASVLALARVAVRVDGLHRAHERGGAGQGRRP